MKVILMSFVLSVLLFACGGEKSDNNHSAMKGHDEMTSHETTAAIGSTIDGEKLIYYTCPMESHKHIHSREPGNCPECGMALVEGVVTSEDKMEYYGCPMLIHSHVRQDEPGRCPECKMELKPMRLKSGS